MAEKPLVINAPMQGISPSPHVGFGDMRNLDIFSIPGIVRLNNILANASTTAVTARVKWIVRDPVTVANIYAVDTAGDVYVSTDSGASFADLGSQPSNGGAGQGAVIWKDHLIIPRATAVDAYGPLSSSPNWNNGFQTDLDTDDEWHPMLVSKNDGKLYIGGGRYVASLSEVVGKNFSDSDAATYIWTPRALTLPEDYRIKSLAELRNNLMIGTWMGSTITDFKIADIFPWDRSSLTYGQPIQMTENGVNAMINRGGYLYILPGIDGKVYKSNGVQAWKIAQIPLSVADILNNKYLEPYPGSIVNYKDRIFFGMSSLSTDGMGVYSLLETSNGNILNFEHFVDTEVTGGTNPLEIGALLSPTRDKLLVGYRDNTTFRIAITNTASYAYTTDYSGYFESPLYQVGTHINLRQFTELEFLLAKELITTEGIQIKFRINLTDSFTIIGTYTRTEIGSGVTSFNTKVNIPACEQLQIRVELLGTSTTTPELKRIMLN